MANYADSTYGDAYFTAKLSGNDIWTAASSGDKTKALAEATTIIDMLNFQGTKTVSAQDNQFPRNDDTVVPDDIKNACCEIAVALLDGVDPDMEYENLRMVSQAYANVRSTYETSIAPEHTRAGVPSVTAWRFLKPYVRDVTLIDVNRVS